jgi:choline kinase
MTNEANRAPKAVILAAGIGARLRPYTEGCHKSLLPVGGSAILERVIRNCLSCGMSQFVLVLGHREEQIRKFIDKSFRGIRVTYITNDMYRTSGDAYSLMLASPVIGVAEFIVLDADEVFDVKVLRRLLDDDSPNALCVDRSTRFGKDDTRVILDEYLAVLGICQSEELDSLAGIPLGMQKIGARTAQVFFDELKKSTRDVARQSESRFATYQRLLTGGVAFKAIDVTDLNWADIDTPQDYAEAELLFASPVVTISRSQQRASDEAASNLLSRVSHQSRRNCFMT